MATSAELIRNRENERKKRALNRRVKMVQDTGRENNIITNQVQVFNTILPVTDETIFYESLENVSGNFFIIKSKNNINISALTTIVDKFNPRITERYIVPLGVFAQKSKFLDDYITEHNTVGNLIYYTAILGFFNNIFIKNLLSAEEQICINGENFLMPEELGTLRTFLKFISAFKIKQSCYKIYFKRNDIYAYGLCKLFIESGQGDLNAVLIDDISNEETSIENVQTGIDIDEITEEIFITHDHVPTNTRNSENSRKRGREKINIEVQNVEESDSEDEIGVVVVLSESEEEHNEDSDEEYIEEDSEQSDEFNDSRDIMSVHDEDINPSDSHESVFEEQDEVGEDDEDQTTETDYSQVEDETIDNSFPDTQDISEHEISSKTDRLIADFITLISRHYDRSRNEITNEVNDIFHKIVPNSSMDYNFYNKHINIKIRKSVFAKIYKILKQTPPTGVQIENIVNTLGIKTSHILKIFSLGLEQSIFCKTVKVVNTTVHARTDFIIIYENIAREFLSNLNPYSHVKNLGLLQRIYNNCLLTAGMLSTNDLFPERNEALIKLREDIIKASEENLLFESMYTCYRCGSRKILYQEINSRSVDEPAIIHYKCTECGHTWRS